MAIPSFDQNELNKVEKIEAFDGKQKILGSIAAQQESNIIFFEWLKKMEMDPLLYRPTVILHEEKGEPLLKKETSLISDEEVERKIYSLNLQEQAQKEMEVWMKALMEDMQKLRDTYLSNIEKHMRSFASQMATYGHVSEKEALKNACDIEEAVADVYEEFDKNPEMINRYISVTPSAPPLPNDATQDDAETLPVSEQVTPETADPRAIDAGYAYYAPQPKPGSSQKKTLTEEEQAKLISEAFTKRLLEKDKELKAQPGNNGKGLFNLKDSDVLTRQMDFAVYSMAAKIAFAAQQKALTHSHLQRNPAIEDQMQSIVARNTSLPRPKPPNSF
ncbi:MAG: hypothetical protein V4496_05685 [Pseudomonadota bacterium]